MRSNSSYNLHLKGIVGRYSIVVFFLITNLSFAVSQKETPNVILIMADDLGYGDIGCYGSQEISTPNLDHLAEKGVRFTQFYSNGPECTPTRTALLTGRYQQRVGGLECAIGLGNVGRYEEALHLSNNGQLGLPKDFSVLPMMFKEKGYQTALIGKWHLGDGPQFSPQEHGFDFAMGPLGGAVDYFHHTEPKGEFLGIEMEGDHDFQRQGKPHHREGYYLTNLITDEAISWLNIQRSETPFFLYLPYTAPHTPYQGPEDYDPVKKTSDQWKIANGDVYKKMVENLDKGIGKIMLELENQNKLENTLIIFLSDNGPTSKGRTGGLRGFKGQVFEGGIRVPAIMRWFGVLPEGMVSDQVSLSMDIANSVASILGYTPKRKFDGYDIISHVTNAIQDVDRTVYWRKKRGEVINRAVRSGEHKYIINQNDTGSEEFLFNLSTDWQEERNILDSDPQTAEKLRKLLTDWESEVQPERKFPR